MGRGGGHFVGANAIGALLENIIYFAAMYKIHLFARLRGCRTTVQNGYLGTSVRVLSLVPEQTLL